MTFKPKIRIMLTCVYSLETFERVQQIPSFVHAVCTYAPVRLCT